MGRLKQRRPDLQETPAVWIDADAFAHPIKIAAVVAMNGNGTVGLEIELPFGKLGGVLTTTLSRTIVEEIARHQGRSKP